jgi:hypothetical protein
MTVRTPEEVFAHHADVLIKGDLDGIVSDYADDAVLITPSGIRRGKAGVREGFEELLSAVPNAQWDVPVQLFVDDLLFIEWTAKSVSSSVADGVDTFVFRDGLIRAQTVRFTVEQA